MILLLLKLENLEIYYNKNIEISSTMALLLFYKRLLAAAVLLLVFGFRFERQVLRKPKNGRSR